MPRRRRLLLLGGTTEATALAGTLAGRPDLEVVVSLAGRTAQPVAPPGELRVGGFGGVDGLVEYLVAGRFDLVVDATHPFATTMPWHAEAACRSAGVPRLRLERPPWRPEPGDRWTAAATLGHAGAIVAAGAAARVLLTTGRRELTAFVPAVDGRRRWVIRCITPPDPQPLRPAEVLLERGPYDLDGERRLLAERGIDLLVTKNSGGMATGAKLLAARDLGIEVVMIARPSSPPGPTVTTAAAALDWVERTGAAAQPAGSGG